MAFSGGKTSRLKSPTHQGEFKEAAGPQGTKQSATVAFTARGEHKYERVLKDKSTKL